MEVLSDDSDVNDLVDDLDDLVDLSQTTTAAPMITTTANLPSTTDTGPESTTGVMAGTTAPPATSGPTKKPKVVLPPPPVPPPMPVSCKTKKCKRPPPPISPGPPPSKPPCTDCPKKTTPPPPAQPTHPGPPPCTDCPSKKRPPPPIHPGPPPKPPCTDCPTAPPPPPTHPGPPPIPPCTECPVGCENGNEPEQVCKSYPIADGMCDLHALRDNTEFLKWGLEYTHAHIEVLDEYVEGVCADGFITVCKDVCDILVLPTTCSNENKPIEVCESYAIPNGMCELAALHDNTDYINDGFKYSNADIEVVDELVKGCDDEFITVCKHVCGEIEEETKSCEPMVCPDVIPDSVLTPELATWHFENAGVAKNMLLKYFYGFRYEMTQEDINAVVYAIDIWDPSCWGGCMADLIKIFDCMSETPVQLLLPAFDDVVQKIHLASRFRDDSCPEMTGSDMWMTFYDMELNDFTFNEMMKSCFGPEPTFELSYARLQDDVYCIRPEDDLESELTFEFIQLRDWLLFIGCPMSLVYRIRFAFDFTLVSCPSDAGAYLVDTVNFILEAIEGRVSEKDYNDLEKFLLDPKGEFGYVIQRMLSFRCFRAEGYPRMDCGRWFFQWLQLGFRYDVSEFTSWGVDYEVIGIVGVPSIDITAFFAAYQLIWYNYFRTLELDWSFAVYSCGTNFGSLFELEGCYAKAIAGPNFITTASWTYGYVFRSDEFTTILGETGITDLAVYPTDFESVLSPLQQVLNAWIDTIGLEGNDLYLFRTAVACYTDVSLDGIYLFFDYLQMFCLSWGFSAESIIAFNLNFYLDSFLVTITRWQVVSLCIMNGFPLEIILKGLQLFFGLGFVLSALTFEWIYEFVLVGEWYIDISILQIPPPGPPALCETSVFEWDFYQQIIYNFITADVGFDLEDGSGTALVIKNMIRSVKLSASNSLAEILDLVNTAFSPTQVILLNNYCTDVDFDYSIIQRIRISFSSGGFANAIVCMAGLNAVGATGEVVFNFINTYETTFTGFLTSLDFEGFFGVYVDIDFFYLQFYRLVKFNVFQGCYMAFFKSQCADETEDFFDILRAFFIYFGGLDLDSEVSLQQQVRSVFFGFNGRLNGLLSGSQLKKLQGITFQQNFNSLIFILRIIRLYEADCQNAAFNFDFFNALSFTGFDWSLEYEALNEVDFYNGIVSAAAVGSVEAATEVGVDLDITDCVTAVQGQYQALVKIEYPFNEVQMIFYQYFVSIGFWETWAQYEVAFSIILLEYNIDFYYAVTLQRLEAFFIRYLFLAEVDIEFILALKGIFVSPDVTGINSVIYSMEEKREEIVNTLEIEFEVSPTDLIAYRELTAVENVFIGLFAGLELSDEVSISVARACMGITSYCDVIEAPGVYYATDVYFFFTNFLLTEGLEPAVLKQVLEILHTKPMVDFFTQMEFFRKLNLCGEVDLTLWLSSYPQIVQSGGIISVESLAGFGLEWVAFEGFVDFDFEMIIEIGYASAQFNVFQGCVMSWFKSYAADIRLEAFIARQVFTFGTFTSFVAQKELRQIFLSWFKESSIEDFDFFFNLSYEGRFSSLIYIFEILLQLEGQIGADFSYVQFNQLVGPEFVDNWFLTDLDFNLKLYSATLAAMTMPEAVLTAVDLEATWTSIYYYILIHLRPAHQFVFEFFLSVPEGGEIAVWENFAEWDLNYVYFTLRKTIGEIEISPFYGLFNYFQIIAIELEFSAEFLVQYYQLIWNFWYHLTFTVPEVELTADWSIDRFAFLSVEGWHRIEDLKLSWMGVYQAMVAEYIFSFFQVFNFDLTAEDSNVAFGWIMRYIIAFNLDFTVEGGLISSFSTYHVTFLQYLAEAGFDASSFNLQYMIYKFNSMVFNMEFRTFLVRLRIASFDVFLTEEKLEEFAIDQSFWLLDGQYAVFNSGFYLVEDGITTSTAPAFTFAELEAAYGFDVGSLDIFVAYGNMFDIDWEFKWFHVMYTLPIDLATFTFDVTTLDGFNTYVAISGADFETIAGDTLSAELVTMILPMYFECVYKISIMSTFQLDITYLHYSFISQIHSFNIGLGYVLADYAVDTTTLQATLEASTEIDYYSFIYVGSVYASWKLGECSAECHDDQTPADMPLASFEFECFHQSAFDLGCAEMSVADGYVYFADQECNTDPCPYWTQTDEYEACPVTCYDEGTDVPVQNRVRVCTNAEFYPALVDVSYCLSSDEFETRDCVDVYWCPTWGDWVIGDCNLVPCETDDIATGTTSGTQRRTRSCSEKSEGVFWGLDEADECLTVDSFVDDACLANIPCSFAEVGEWTVSNEVFNVIPSTLEESCGKLASCRRSESRSFIVTEARKCIVNDDESLSGPVGSDNCKADESFQDVLATRDWNCLADDASYDYRPVSCDALQKLSVVVRFKIVIKIKIPIGTIPVAGFNSDEIAYDAANSAMLLYSQYLTGENSNMSLKFKAKLKVTQKFVSIRIRTVIRIRIRVRARRSLSRRERRAIGEDYHRVEADRKFLDDDDFDAVIESARFRRQDIDATTPVMDDATSAVTTEEPIVTEAPETTTAAETTAATTAATTAGATTTQAAETTTVADTTAAETTTVADTTAATTAATTAGTTVATTAGTTEATTAGTTVVTTTQAAETTTVEETTEAQTTEAVTTAEPEAEVTIEEAELFFTVTIPTAYAAGTEPDSSELTEFLESLKESEYTEGSTLDKIEFHSWNDPADGFDRADVDFTFTAKTAVTAESRRRRAVDDDTFAAVAADIEDDLEAALETLASENDGGILPQDLDITEDDFSEPDITTEDEEPEYDTEVETEAAYDETFEVDDPTTCDNPADLGLDESIDAASKEALECDVAANSGADEIGAEAASALAELSEIAALNDPIEADVETEAIETFVPGSESTEATTTTVEPTTTTVTTTTVITTTAEVPTTTTVTDSTTSTTIASTASTAATTASTASTTKLTTEPTTESTTTTIAPTTTTVCEEPKFVTGPCVCDVATGKLTKTFTRTCPACAPDCESERVEVCTDGTCPAWTAWTDETECQENKTRVRIRECLKDGVQNVECPGEDSEIIDCIPKECINLACDCDIDSATFGTKNGVCSVGENLGSIGLDAGCGCVETACADECAGWGDWSVWGPWMPKCIDNNDGSEDTILDDQAIHQPKRFRSRDCFVKDATGALTTETVSISKTLGECLFADKFETEFEEDPETCPEPDIPAGEIETKVIVDFDVIIYEHWTPDLLNPTTEEFKDLANLYLAAFTNTLAEVDTNEVDTLTSISFATIRVMSFSLDTSTFRKRREEGRDNLKQIKAAMETVYSVQGKGDEVDSGRHAVLDESIKTKVFSDVGAEVKKRVDEVINPKKTNDHVVGELNFLRRSEVQSVKEERDVLATYGPIQIDCDCKNGKRIDYRLCEEQPNRDTECLNGPRRLVGNDEEPGYTPGMDCKCAAYTDFVAVNGGECVDGEITYSRECVKDTVVFVDEDKNVCPEKATKKSPCGNFTWGKWDAWLFCSENCGVGVTTRTRTCTALGDDPCPAEGSPLVFESKPCQLQKCLTCENYENYCDNQINTECKDETLDNGETTAKCQCKSPFGLDAFKQCTECNVLAPLRWQCDQMAVTVEPVDDKAAGARTQIAWTLLGVIMAFQYILN